MRIGFIGAGENALTLARHFLIYGNDVVLSNSRGPDTLTQVIADLGKGASAGTKNDAAAADIIILAVNWVNVRDALQGINWTNKILVDATNAHSANPPDFSVAGVARSRAALGGRTSSEIVAEWAPGARLVKSISNTPMSWITNFGPSKPRTVIFTAGDDLEAKNVVIGLLEQVGFASIDLGSLAGGGAMFQLGAPLSGIELHYIQRVRRPE